MLEPEVQGLTSEGGTMKASEATAMAKSQASTAQRRRPGAGGKKLAPIEDGAATQGIKTRKAFSKRDLIESVRKMAVSV